MDEENGTFSRLWDFSFWSRFFQLLLVERIDTAKQLIDQMNKDDVLARSRAIQFMHGIIDKIESDAEAQLPSDQRFVDQLIPDAKNEGRSETYLKALRQAEHHLNKLTPRIIDMKTEQFLRLKRNLLVQSIEQ